MWTALSWLAGSVATGDGADSDARSYTHRYATRIRKFKKKQNRKTSGRKRISGISSRETRMRRGQTRCHYHSLFVQWGHSVVPAFHVTAVIGIY